MPPFDVNPQEFEYAETILAAYPEGKLKRTKEIEGREVTRILVPNPEGTKGAWQEIEVTPDFSILHSFIKAPLPARSEESKTSEQSTPTSALYALNASENGEDAYFYRTQTIKESESRTQKRTMKLAQDREGRVYVYKVVERVGEQSIGDQPNEIHFAHLMEQTPHDQRSKRTYTDHTKETYIFYYLGQDLNDYLKDSSELPENERIMLALKMLTLINGLHESGIVHRDLKLENILVDLNCKLSLIDWETAYQLSDQATGINLPDCRGTIGSMAPEIFQAERGNTDSYFYDINTTEVYALGVSLGRVFNIWDYFLLFDKDMPLEIEHDTRLAPLIQNGTLYKNSLVLRVREVANGLKITPTLYRYKKRSQELTPIVFKEGLGTLRNHTNASTYRITKNKETMPILQKITQACCWIPTEIYITTPSLQPIYSALYDLQQRMVAYDPTRRVNLEERVAFFANPVICTFTEQFLKKMWHFQSCILNASENYLGYHNTFRFTLFHGADGKERVMNLMREITQARTLEEIRQSVFDFFQAKNVGVHNHSFISFFLEALQSSMNNNTLSPEEITSTFGTQIDWDLDYHDKSVLPHRKEAIKQIQNLVDFLQSIYDMSRHSLSGRTSITA